MLATSMCREVRFPGIPSTFTSNVPRCLFGPANAKETVEMLQEALEIERTRFARRWGVDPRNEDKENLRTNSDKTTKIKSHGKSQKTPPYSRQSNIYEYWRSRKNYDSSNKVVPLSSGDTNKRNVESSTQSS